MKRNAPIPQTNMEIGEAAIKQFDDSVQEMNLARDASMTMIAGQMANMTETAAKMRDEAECAAKLKQYYEQREASLREAAKAIEDTVDRLNDLLIQKGK